MVDASESTQLVQFLIEQVEADWPEASFPDHLYLVDRMNSEEYDGADTLRTKDAALESGNYLSFANASSSSTPTGPNYCLDIEDVVSCQLEGLHTAESGHVANAAEFEQLWNNIRDAIYENRSAPLGQYKNLYIENIRQASDDYQWYFLTNFEVRFRGREDL